MTSANEGTGSKSRDAARTAVFFRLTESEHRELKLHAVKSKTTIQAIMQELVRDYLKGLVAGEAAGEEKLDLALMWPELFALLTDSQVQSVERSLVANWHDGWEPNREDVENLVDFVREVIDFDEYTRRGQEAAEHHVLSGLYDGADEREPYRLTP